MSVRLLRVATTLVVCLIATAARGASGDVAVIRPPGNDHVLVEAAARLRQELGASGLTSDLVDAADDTTTQVAFVREDGVVTIAVVAARDHEDGANDDANDEAPAQAPARRRVHVSADEGGDDPSVLAVRAVELLRALRLEVRPAPAAPPPPPLEPDVVEAPPPTPRLWHLAAGASLLEARPYAAARARGPTVGASVAVLPYASLVAAFAGPFFTDRPPTPGGSAHTREELAVLGIRLETRRRRVNVHAAFMAGLHHLAATYDDRGTTGPPTVLHLVTPQSVWTPVISLSAGASGRVWHSLGVTVEVTAIVAQPSIEIVANERSLGTIGGPSLLQTLWAWIAFP
ncbi:MAG TPA: hypothetical protein VH560_14960 [Polyangia bacterium]|nr:hypothetical protein [Polyangia bacterium]